MTVCTEIVPCGAAGVGLGARVGVGEGGEGVAVAGAGFVAVGGAVVGIEGAEAVAVAVAGTARAVLVAAGVRFVVEVARVGLAWGCKKSGRFTVIVQPAVTARNRKTHSAAAPLSARFGKMLTPVARTFRLGPVRGRTYDSTGWCPPQVGRARCWLAGERPRIWSTGRILAAVAAS